MAADDPSSLSFTSRKLFSDDIIIGCSGLAGIYNELFEEDAVRGVRTSIECGFKNFDVAPHYGLGLAEERLGLALSQYPDFANDDIRIWSKVGRIIIESSEKQNYSADEIEYENIPGSETCIFPSTPLNRLPILNYSAQGFHESYQGSLQRLKKKQIYGLRIHDCETLTRLNQLLNLSHIDQTEQTVSYDVKNKCHNKNEEQNDDDEPNHDNQNQHDEEQNNDDDDEPNHDNQNQHDEEQNNDVMGGLDRLIEMRDKDNIISEIGLGMNDVHYILTILTSYQYAHKLDSIMMAGKWNLLDQSGSSVLIQCQAMNIQVHNAGILCSGLLAGGSHLNYKKVDISEENDDEDKKEQENNNGEISDIKLKLSKWKQIALKYGFSVYELAIGFASLPTIVTKVAIGISNENEVVDIRNCLSKLPMPTTIWKEAFGQGLIAKDCVNILDI